MPLTCPLSALDEKAYSILVIRPHISSKQVYHSMVFWKRDKIEAPSRQDDDKNTQSQNVLDFNTAIN